MATRGPTNPLRGREDIPALERFLEEQYGGRYMVRQSTVTCGTSMTRVADHDFERLGLTLINTGGNDVHITPGQFASTTNGILLGSSGGFLSITARNDLVLVGWEWYGVATGSSSLISVMEVVRYTD